MRLRRETLNLEKLLGDLKTELDLRINKAQKNNMGPEYEDWEDEKVAYEIKMQREQSRIDAMEEEMAKNENKF